MPPPADSPRLNVLITGTPGTGKSTLCNLLSHETGRRHLDVGTFAREGTGMLHKYDAEFDTHTLHEDEVLNQLEPEMAPGGVFLDHHSVDWFPERWIQLVIVLRTSTEMLHDRLTARNYSKKKVDENMQAEIMQVVLDEARENYKKVPVIELKSDSPEQQAENVKEVLRQIRLIENPPPLDVEMQE